jgi:RNA methyltransferase, TrmH family
MINSPQNPLIKHVVKLQEKRSYRRDHREAIVEGVKIIRELQNVKTLLVSDESLIPENINAEKIIPVSESVMKKICRTKSPEGIAAIVAMPPDSSLDKKSKILALDGIGDPGNLGTLLRTALAFGWEGVYLLESCCDPYNEKALRAAKGATFKLPLTQGSLHDFIPFCKKNEFQILIADLSGTPPEKIKPSEKRLLVLGSESEGISKEIAALGEAVSLPMAKTMESLNVAVAGGILMHSL